MLFSIIFLFKKRRDFSFLTENAMIAPFVFVCVDIFFNKSILQQSETLSTVWTKSPHLYFSSQRCFTVK